ncbi:extracellular solute-binding protein [Streptomyces sp. M19]
MRRRHRSGHPRLRAGLGPQAWTNGTLDGRVYGIPLDLGPMLLAYRADILDAHHIEAPTTWEEFREAARGLKRRSGVRLATFHPNAYNVLAGHVMQSGGQWFATEGDSWVLDFLDEPTRRVADYWQGLIDEDLLLVAPAAARSGCPRSPATGSPPTWSARGARGPGLLGARHLRPLARGPAAAVGHGRAGPRHRRRLLHAITADSPRKERAMRFLEWMSTARDAITARLSSGRSSLFPAARNQVEAASRQFSTDFYDGQDLYALVADQAACCAPAGPGDHACRPPRPPCTTAWPGSRTARPSPTRCAPRRPRPCPTCAAWA